jgi:hypothetical protein
MPNILITYYIYIDESQTPLLETYNRGEFPVNKYINRGGALCGFRRAAGRRKIFIF